MKKSLIALAALAASGAVFAQSSVTLFGIVDAAYEHGSGSVSSKNQLANSGYNSSRLGFRGVEDLGGGMSASFWLEGQLQNDNGAGAATNTNNQASGGALAGMNGGQGFTFGRRSTVSLSGGFGELRLGRDYTPQFWNLTIFDPFGTNGVGTTQTLNSIITGATAVRASNSIGYFLPGNLGGFYGQVNYWMGENNSGTATHNDGNGYGLRFGWGNGPLNVAVATSRTTYAAGDVHQSNIGGQYNFGMATLMAHYARDKNGSITGKGWLVGGLIPVGPGDVRLAYSRYETDAVGSPETKKWALGYVYNMSKRTALYATYAHVSNGGTAAQALGGAVTTVGGSSTGYDLGIRHSF
jgi:predicted porin